MGHHHHHHNSSDGISQRVSSPRFSGPMTRRAHSFKRNNSENNNNNNSTSNSTNNSGTSGGSGNTTTLSTHHEIDVHIGSPRSEMGTSPVSPDGFDSTSSALERKHHHLHHVSHRVNIHGSSTSSLIKGFLLNKSGVVELGFRGKKKLGHWMFFLFCGMCVFLGLLKICATGWFGSAIESATSNQVTSCSCSCSYQ